MSNEIEDTYVWLFEKFLIAMKGKILVSIVTDGDNAMKNALGRFFL
jgi:hypothetical protein